jgi:hypothetical protein
LLTAHSSLLLHISLEFNNQHIQRIWQVQYKQVQRSCNCNISYCATMIRQIDLLLSIMKRIAVTGWHQQRSSSLPKLGYSLACPNMRQFGCRLTTVTWLQAAEVPGTLDLHQNAHGLNEWCPCIFNKAQHAGTVHAEYSPIQSLRTCLQLCVWIVLRVCAGARCPAGRHAGDANALLRLREAQYQQIPCGAQDASAAGQMKRRSWTH